MCLELCSRANWRQILVLCHSWETPRAGHGEFSMLCKGNCQTLGQGTWPESPDSSLGNSAVICHEHSKQDEGRQQGQGLDDAALEAAMSQCKAGGWLGLRTGRGRQVTPRKDGGSWATICSCKRCPKLSLHLSSAVSSWTGPRLSRGYHRDRDGSSSKLEEHLEYTEIVQCVNSQSWMGIGISAAALSKDTIKLSHRRPKTSVLILST